MAVNAPGPISFEFLSNCTVRSMLIRIQSIFSLAWVMASYSWLLHGQMAARVASSTSYPARGLKSAMASRTRL